MFLRIVCLLDSEMGDQLSTYVIVTFRLAQRNFLVEGTDFTGTFLFDSGKLDEHIETCRQACIERLTTQAVDRAKILRRRNGPGALVLDLVITAPEIVRQSIQSDLVVQDIRQYDNEAQAPVA